MDIRYSANPKDVARYTTEELRKEFLITDLYEKDAVKATYSHVDRMVVLGILPVDEIVPIETAEAFAWDNLIEFIPVEGADHRFMDPAKMDAANAQVISWFGLR